MQKWTMVLLAGLLASCQMIDPAALNGLFGDGSSDDSGAADTEDPGTGGGTGGDDGGGTGETGGTGGTGGTAGGDGGGGTGGDDGGGTDGGGTGEPEPEPCTEDISLRLSDGRDEERLDLTSLRSGQAEGQVRRSAVQVPSGAEGVSGAWLVGHGPDFLIGAQLPPGKLLSIRLEPLGGSPDEEPDHLVAFLDGCPQEPDLCTTDDPTARFGDCIGEIESGRWWGGFEEGWQASIENSSADDLYTTILVDTTYPLEFETARLVYEVTDL